MPDPQQAASSDIPKLFQQAQLAMAAGDARTALRYAHQAWALDPNNADLCNLVGLCALRMGDAASAQRLWQHALMLSAGCHEAHFNLALLHAGRAEAAEAERHLRCVVLLQASHAGAHAQLGLLLAARKRYAEAEASYRQALALAPMDSSIHSNLGVLLATLGRLEEAGQCHRKAVELAPASASAHANLGLLLESCGSLDEAEIEFRTAASLDPASSEIHANLANVLMAVHRIAEAEQDYRKAIALKPTSAVAHSNLGVLFAYDGREAEGEQALRHALELAPSYQRARLNLAMLLLSQGRLAEGWALHEARHHPDLPDPDAPLPVLPFPQWQGESLTGKSLLIWPEQGYGDMIQFCRYVPQLKRQGAARITLVCKPALAGLMRSLEGVDAVFPLGDPAALERTHDFWTLPMSLPLHCGTELTTIPSRTPYLSAPPDRRLAWAQRLPPDETKLRIGLSWQGNPKHANNRHRSLPGIATLAPLWAVESLRTKIEFVSLQHGADVAGCEYVTALGREVADFGDTAAIVAHLDLLISVDTAVAHVAGALGKPCWVLLPAYHTDWRWLRERNDSPWYPHMRLFRQARDGDWSTPIAHVVKALQEFIAAPPG